MHSLLSAVVSLASFSGPHLFFMLSTWSLSPDRRPHVFGTEARWWSAGGPEFLGSMLGFLDFSTVFWLM